MDNKWTTNLLLLPPITAALIDKWADEKHRIPKLVQTKGYSNISRYFNNPFLTNCGIDREAAKRFLFARNFLFVGMALGDATEGHQSGLEALDQASFLFSSISKWRRM